MSKFATLFASFMTKFAAFRAKLANACALTSSVPNVMGREEADQTNARLKAMQRHADAALSHEKYSGNIKVVASHIELDSVNSDHWFEKEKQHYGEEKAGDPHNRVTKNRLMSQSKMTHTRLNAYIDTIKKDTDNDIDRDAQAESEK